MTKSSTDRQAVDVLEHLLVVCQDGVDGYRRAAEDVPAGPVRDFLASASARREELASMLTHALVELGHKPVHRGSIAAAAHRRWLDAVAALAGAPEAVLGQCQRGERQSLAAFAAAMGRSLPEAAHRLVRDVFERFLEASAALNKVAADLDATHVGAAVARRVSEIMNPKLLYMAGKTDVMVGRWNRLFTHVALEEVLAHDKRVDPEGDLWAQVLESTGQPAF